MKKLNTDLITNDLEGSAFFPSKKIAREEPVSAPTSLSEPNKPYINELPGSTDQSDQYIPERSNARSTVRPNIKRIITRNSFEIYEDQMDSLRQQAYHEKMEGKIGSMSAMVREAIDNYLKEKVTKV